MQRSDAKASLLAFASEAALISPKEISCLRLELFYWEVYFEVHIDFLSVSKHLPELLDGRFQTC